MKIGVALSGCEIGGVAAFAALRELEEQGMEIGMVSACGVPAVTALLFALGYEEDACCKLAGEFLQNARSCDMDLAVAELSVQVLPARRKAQVPLVISSVDVADGRICAFSSERLPNSRRLNAFPLEDAYDALSATISPVDGLATYPFADCSLCDFSVWYGCPVYPLKMAAVEKIISLAFLPEEPRTPYEALVKHRITGSASLADAHLVYSGEHADLEGCRAAAAQQTRTQMDALLARLLF